MAADPCISGDAFCCMERSYEYWRRQFLLPLVIASFGPLLSSIALPYIAVTVRWYALRGRWAWS
eukprot:7058405-Pyramimonas_sp.AAC.1